jgi:hypothetical protein
MATYRENAGYHFLVFAASPVLGLLYAIKTRSQSVIRWSIFAFTAIYGSLYHRSYGGDGSAHWDEVYRNYIYLSFDVWWDRMLAILSFSPTPYTNDDPFIHIISYLTGSVLNAPGLFFTVVGIFYAYFYSGAIVKLLSYVNWNSNYNKFFVYFFLIMLLLWKSPNNMQTVRSWTGMWVLIYAAISYYETKKWKYLILALTPPLIHIGYIVLAFPVWVVLFSGYRNPKVYFIIFVLSMFFSNAVERFGLVQNLSQTDVGASKTSSYYYSEEDAAANEGKLKKSSGTSPFYLTYQENKIHIYVLTAMIFFMYFFLRGSGFTKIENTLFSYGLAAASMSNFFTQVFAVYNRGWLIAGMFIISMMVIFLSKNNLKNVRLSFLKVRLPLTLFSIALFPYGLFLLSVFISYTSYYIFLLPQIQWVNPDELALTIRGFLGLFL